MSEAKASEFAGNQMRYVTYDQDISTMTIRYRLILYLKAKLITI